jgi:hypothetical protein
MSAELDKGDNFIAQQSVAYNVAAHASASEVSAACKSAYPDEQLAELQEGLATETDTAPVDQFKRNRRFRNRMIDTALAAANSVSSGKAWKGYIAGIGAGISLVRDDNRFAELIGLFYTKTMAEFLSYAERQQMCRAADKTARETDLAMQKLSESGDYSLVYVIFNLREATKKPQ